MSKDLFRSWSFRVSTPDGSMTVIVMEDETGDAFEVQTFIGKAGSAVAAWCAACAAMISLALRNKVDIQDIINDLADITSDGTARIGASTVCRSGPEGIYSALIQYRNQKREEASDRQLTTSSST